MKERNVTIYFMSGTGNSFRVASWILEYCLKQESVSAVLRPVERANPAGEIMDGPDNLLGIVMPTHAFTAPWHIIKYVLCLPHARETRAFCIATRAGMKVGPVFTPGVSGTGTYLIALLLALKGYRVAGVASIDMPSNWLACHPALSPASVSAIVARARPKVEAFIGRVFGEGRSNWWSLNNLYEAVFGTLLIPVSLGYLFAGRFYLGKLFFANNSCNGCSQCAENCMAGAIRMIGVAKKRPYWLFRCESCMRCMAYCPRKAIEAGHSWAVMLYFITTVPVAVYLFDWLGATVPALAAVDSRIVRLMVSLAYLYTSLFLSYLVFNLLVRIPFVNNLFAWTTLTRFYRRYNEPDTRVRDLV